MSAETLQATNERNIWSEIVQELVWSYIAVGFDKNICM